MFLDTSGLFAMLHVDETSHQEAARLFEDDGPKLIHGYILAELVALAMARRLPRGPVLGFVRALVEHPEVVVVWVDSMLHDEAMRLLEDRSDKSYSLADAISFVLMRRFALSEALTTDHHFEQEGFRRLLQP
jgi:predicted nucleic acid-binding protein